MRDYPATHRGAVCTALALLLLGLVLSACTKPYEFKGTAYPEGKVAPEFTALVSGGQPLRLSDLRGKVVLLFFGYTSCPDICPTTLTEAKQVLDELGGQAESVRFLFITVDPERDTADKLAAYTQAFHPAILGVTGDPQGLTQARADYGVVAEKQELPGSAVGYVINHTARVFLVDQAGNLRLSYGYGTPPEDILADVRHLLQSGS